MAPKAKSKPKAKTKASAPDPAAEISAPGAEVEEEGGEQPPPKKLKKEPPAEGQAVIVKKGRPSSVLDGREKTAFSRWLKTQPAVCWNSLDQKQKDELKAKWKVSPEQAANSVKTETSNSSLQENQQRQRWLTAQQVAHQEGYADPASPAVQALLKGLRSRPSRFSHLASDPNFMEYNYSEADSTTTSSTTATTTTATSEASLDASEASAVQEALQASGGPLQTPEGRPKPKAKALKPKKEQTPEQQRQQELNQLYNSLMQEIRKSRGGLQQAERQSEDWLKGLAEAALKGLQKLEEASLELQAHVGLPVSLEQLEAWKEKISRMVKAHREGHMKKLRKML